MSPDRGAAAGDEGRGPEPAAHVLEIALDPTRVTVSAMSSLLRVVQAAIREVARNDVDAGAFFARRPEPVLILSGLFCDRDLVLRFAFADPVDGTPDHEVSAQAFRAFLQEFTSFMRGMAQPSLWGFTTRRSSKQGDESELTKRMDQVRLELRRFRGARLSFGGQSVRIEGDQMEIS